MKETTRRITGQEGGFLNFLKPLISVGSPLMKNVLTPLANSFLVPLALTAAASETEQPFKRKVLDWDILRTLVCVRQH